MKLLTLDIEAKRLVMDWDRPWEAGVACCGALASWHPAPMIYDEHNLRKLPALVEDADVVITYNGERYDRPVLEHFVGPLKIKHHADMMQPIYETLGWRPKLEDVTRPTLGMGKGGRGASAPDLFQQGLFGQLHSYCLRDVGIEHQLYLHMEQRGYVLVWDREKEMTHLVELHQVGRRPAKGWSPGFWHTAMGVR